MPTIKEIFDEREKDPKLIKKNREDIERLHNMEVGDVCVISHPYERIDKKHGDMDLETEIRSHFEQYADDFNSAVDDESLTRKEKKQVSLWGSIAQGAANVFGGIASIGVSALKRQGPTKSSFVDETCVCVGHTNNGAIFVPLQNIKNNPIPPIGYNGHMYNVMVVTEGEIPRYNIDISMALNNEQKQLVESLDVTGITNRYVDKVAAERKHNETQSLFATVCFGDKGFDTPESSKFATGNKEKDITNAAKMLLAQTSAMRAELSDSLGLSAEDESKIKFHVFLPKQSDTTAFKREVPKKIHISVSGLEHGDIYSDSFNFESNSQAFEQAVENVTKKITSAMVYTHDRDMLAGFDMQLSYEERTHDVLSKHKEYYEEITMPFSNTTLNVNMLDSTKSNCSETKLNEDLLSYISGKETTVEYSL